MQVVGLATGLTHGVPYPPFPYSPPPDPTPRPPEPLLPDPSLAQSQAVLGLATGSTPMTLYTELIRLHWEEGLSFANVVSFNLDE